MTKREKRLQKIRQNPKNVDYDDLITVLEEYGFTIRPSKGSHVYIKCTVGEKVWTQTLVKPHSGKSHVNQSYVKQSLKIIDEVIDALAELGEEYEEIEKEDDNGE